MEASPLRWNIYASLGKYSSALYPPPHKYDLELFSLHALCVEGDVVDLHWRDGKMCIRGCAVCAGGKWVADIRIANAFTSVVGKKVAHCNGFYAVAHCVCKCGLMRCVYDISNPPAKAPYT